MVNLYFCHKLNTNHTDYYMYCIIVESKQQQTLLFQFKKNFRLSRITFQLLKEQFENLDICTAAHGGNKKTPPDVQLLAFLW